MSQIKKLKRLALATALCLFTNMVCFAEQPTAVVDDAPILGSYNFDDGELPANFSSFNFKVEDGKLRAFGKWSKFSFADMPRNCSIEFKIKPIENRIIPRFYVKLRDDATFYYNNNSVISEDPSSQFILMSSSDNQQKGNDSVSETNHFKPGNEYTLKYFAQDNEYGVYLNGEQIISASYEPQSGEIKSGMEFALMCEDNTVGIIDFYLDDIVVRGKASALDIPSDAMYAYNFEDGRLPNGFNATDYSIEDGELKINSKICTFSFPGLAKDSSIEFRIKPIEGFVIPHFNVLVGNGSFSYTANYCQNPSWDDRFVVYNAETWGSHVGSVYAGDTYFSEKQRGHKVRVVAEGDTHSLYIDDNEILSAECPVKDGKEGYDLTFTLTGKDQFENVGFYLDDIVVKGKMAGADIDAEILHEYNFDDGIMPLSFDSSAFRAEDGRLRSSGSSSSFSIPNVPKNSYVEFKMASAADNVIPGFSINYGNALFTYVANFVQDATWDDQIIMYNASTGNKITSAWATDSFFSDGDNTVKCFTDGDTYSLYINNKKLISEQSPANKPQGRYNFTFRAGTAGKVSNIGFYTDDITVKHVNEKTAEDTAENQSAHVVADTWTTQKGSDGISYAGFDVEITAPEGKVVNSFWLTLNGKNSTLISTEPIEGGQSKVIPVVMKYTGQATAEDVKIYVK